MTRRAVSCWARAAVLWGVVLLGLSQLALAVLLEVRPEIRDPEYGIKLARLRALLASAPGRPLVLVLGSSRAAMGFRPDIFAAAASWAPSCHVFNFAMVGGGPLTELLCLRRLLQHEIRPEHLLLEVWPPYLRHYQEQENLCKRGLRWDDLPAISRHFSPPRAAYARWRQEQLLPSFQQRFELVTWLAPSWLPEPKREGERFWRGLDAGGWLPYPWERGGPDTYRRRIDATRAAFRQIFDNFTISPTAEQVFPELLDLCRQAHIAVTLLIMPEGSEFRSWYTPMAHVHSDAFIHKLCLEYGLPLIDARRWIADEYLADSFHLFPEGAHDFSARLGREMPALLQEGRPNEVLAVVHDVAR